MPLSHPNRASLRWWAQEDWLAVWLGSISLLIILLGLRPSLPALKWRDVSSISALLAPTVVEPWVFAGIIAWLLSLPGIALLGGDVRRYSLGFPVVFMLAWTSHLLAGPRRRSFSPSCSRRSSWRGRKAPSTP